MTDINDTIVALATPPGLGAIGVIRISGNSSFEIINKVFYGKDISKANSHTVHFGSIRDGKEILDEVVVTIFKGPRSYTLEDVIEISCHGSTYILQSVIQLLIRNGARLAKPGEFTQRAFINGRFDLAQAEAVADLIAAESEAAHSTAMKQMRGGFSGEIKLLREELIHFASMIELELDFSEEDVEFASRDELKALIHKIQKPVEELIKSFELGNALKNGIPVVIAGKPNAGKSTLLNALINEERAIVSDIPGTTRDVIEDTFNIEGTLFRFIDTAGVRETQDKIEAIGVERTKEKMKQAKVIVLLLDMHAQNKEEIEEQIAQVESYKIPYLVLGNKMDLNSEPEVELDTIIKVSAKEGTNLDLLRSKLLELTQSNQLKTEGTIITSIRHYESLQKTKEALSRVLDGIDSGISNDFLAMDIRESLQHLGEITGDITTDDLLDNIFSKFCIGK